MSVFEGSHITLSYYTLREQGRKAFSFSRFWQRNKGEKKIKEERKTEASILYT